ncbi:hypothetical protein N0V90_009775 [Kalmusia sp. IMI 367209]|nr:hypothetical protein N0V90_009775 [Kalmusia sp. IMI 367209]
MSLGPAGGDLEGVETVDLTLSPSPEPDPQPRRPPRQQQLASYLKKENRASPNATRDASLAGPRAQTAITTDPPLPSIPADKLRQIIKTTPPARVSDLLIDLCNASPALSGAVVRGLAPHSVWAQQTIKDYQRRNGLSQVKPDPGKSRPSLENNVYMPQVTPNPKASVKNEVDTISIGSDSSDGLDDLEVLDQPARSFNFSHPSSAESPSYSVRNSRDSSKRTPTHDSTLQNNGQLGLSVRVNFADIIQDVQKSSRQDLKKFTHTVAAIDLEAQTDA